MDDMNKTVIIARGNHAHAIAPQRDMFNPDPADDAIIVDDYQVSHLHSNPTIRYSFGLFALVLEIRQQPAFPSNQALFQKLAVAITQFEQHLTQANLRSEHVLACRYAICCVLDEAILTSQWGRERAWQRHTLLSYFHKETFGGAKFFLILEKLTQNPANNLNIIEFMYFCLSYGFQGKYRLEAHATERLQRLQDELFKLISTYRPESHAPLSSKIVPSTRKGRKLARRTPLWLVTSFLLLLGTTAFFGFRYWAQQSALPLQEQLRLALEAKAPSEEIAP